MNLVNRVFNISAGLILNKYKYSLSEDVLNFRSAYLELLPEIKKYYRESVYWHGTGRYHYAFDSRFRYLNLYSENTSDVLTSIILDGGIKPQIDLWATRNGRKMVSVSMTRSRMYARVYAGFHQYEKVDFEYTYGPLNLWFYLIGFKQLFYNNIILNLFTSIKSHTNTKLSNDLANWAGYVKKNIPSGQIRFLNFFRLRSDIPDNFGLLFGFKKQGIKIINYNPTLERFENRTSDLVKFTHMTHLEVPFAHYLDIKMLFKKSGINLPVIPLEFGEIYCNSLNIDNII